MSAETLSRRAGLLADRSRAAICLALIDGRAWTAKELACHAGISASTATGHLNALVAAGVLSELRQGRHRYLRLAGPEVAQLLEDLGGPEPAGTGLRQVRADVRLAAGRTCYDHLAGDLGVAIHDALIARDLLTGAGLTDLGRAWFADLLGPDSLQAPRSRPLVRACLDWTRRTPHLGGSLGAALCSHLLVHGWIRRSALDRSVEVTAAGSQGLHTLLGL